MKCCIWRHFRVLYVYEDKSDLKTLLLHQNLEISLFGPLKHKMVYPICIVSLCLGKSIRMRRVVISVSEDLLLTLQNAQT